MRTGCNVFLVIFCLAIVGILGRAQAHAQTIWGSASIALKSGESVEVGNVYYAINCRSLLKSAPEVEVLEGPPGVTASIKEGMVLPRASNCAKRVPGGTLVLTAKDIEDPSYTPLTLRFIFRTKDGERKLSQVFNLSLVP
jgi:hypothetical protein